MPELKIGALADRTGTNTPTIRYYEEIGLLPRPDGKRATSAAMATRTCAG